MHNYIYVSDRWQDAASKRFLFTTCLLSPTPLSLLYAMNHALPRYQWVLKQTSPHSPLPEWHMNMPRCQVLYLRYLGMAIVLLRWCPRKGSWRIPSPSGLWYREQHRNSTFVKYLKLPLLAAFMELILTDPTGHFPKAKATPWATTSAYKQTRISTSLGCLSMGVLVWGLNHDRGLQGYLSS